MAQPIEENKSRCGSLEPDRAITQKVTAPGCNDFNPSFFEIILHLGGSIEETVTRFLCFYSSVAQGKLERTQLVFVVLPSTFREKQFFWNKMHFCKTPLAFFITVRDRKPSVSSEGF